jgi:TRAP-type C4-dicarboxylate transport system permease small subunit
MAPAQGMWHNYKISPPATAIGTKTIVDPTEADSSRYQKSLYWLGTRVADVGLWAGATALLAIVVLNAVNIILRYFFRTPLSWAEEAMLYLMIFGVYVGTISVAWQQAHIRIDALLDFAPPARRRILQVLSTLVLAAVLVPVVFASFRVVSLLFEFDQRSDALHLPMWIPQSVVPISLLLIALMSLLRIFVQVSGADSDAKDARGPI